MGLSFWSFVGRVVGFVFFFIAVHEFYEGNINSAIFRLLEAIFLVIAIREYD